MTDDQLIPPPVSPSPPATCPVCRYDLGDAPPHCPECGVSTDQTRPILPRLFEADPRYLRIVRWMITLQFLGMVSWALSLGMAFVIPPTGFSGIGMLHTVLIFIPPVTWFGAWLLSLIPSRTGASLIPAPRILSIAAMAGFIGLILLRVVRYIYHRH